MRLPLRRLAFLEHPLLLQHLDNLHPPQPLGLLRQQQVVCLVRLRQLQLLGVSLEQHPLLLLVGSLASPPLPHLCSANQLQPRREDSLVPQRQPNQADSLVPLHLPLEVSSVQHQHLRREGCSAPPPLLRQCQLRHLLQQMLCLLNNLLLLKTRRKN